MADRYESLRAVLRKHDLSRRAEFVVAAALPSIRLGSGPQPDRPGAAADVVRRASRAVHAEPVADVARVSAVAVGPGHCLALLAGGAVIGWGSNEQGELGDGTRFDRTDPVLVGGLASGVTAIAAGAAHSLAVLTDGTAIAWGNNAHGCLGEGSDARRRLTPASVLGIDGRVVDVSAGYDHSAFLTEHGSVFACGWLSWRPGIGRQGDRDETDGPAAAVRLDLPRRAVSISAGARSFAVTDDGRLFTWTFGSPDPVVVNGVSDVVAIAGARDHRVALGADGSLTAWASSSERQAGSGAAVTLEEPQTVTLTGVRAVGIAALEDSALALCDDASVVSWGRGEVVPNRVAGLESGVMAVSGGETALAVMTDGSVRWWGRRLGWWQDERPTVEDDLPMRASKFGGRPDLPHGAVWPTVADVPQSFVAQVNLADITGLDGADQLPRDGTLAFFVDSDQLVDGYEPEEREGWAVVHTPAGLPVTRVEFPELLPVSARLLPVPMRPRSEITVPTGNCEARRQLGLTPDETERLDEASRELYGVADPWSEPVHRLLGHFQPVQPGHDQARRCQLAYHRMSRRESNENPDDRVRDLESRAPEWQLLLQVASDESMGFMWGDVGSIYYWIRSQDLIDRRFDRVWMLAQEH